MSGKPKGHFWLCIISHAKSQASLERAKLFGKRGILKKSDLRGILCYYCRSYCDRAKPGLSQKSTWKLLCLWWLMSHPITSAMSTFNAFVLLAMAMIYVCQRNQLYLLKQQLKEASLWGILVIWCSKRSIILYLFLVLFRLSTYHLDVVNAGKTSYKDVDMDQGCWICKEKDIVTSLYKRIETLPNHITVAVRTMQ